jgi:hypothetical protein
LEINNIEIPINFLMDTGSDYSLLPRELVQEGFGIQIEDLPSGEDQQGLGGIFPTVQIEGKIRFGPSQSPFEEDINFIISKDPTIEPNFCLIGREPFFNHYRVDFRMGWKKRGTCGKFTIFPENKTK